MHVFTKSTGRDFSLAAEMLLSDSEYYVRSLHTYPRREKHVTNKMLSTGHEGIQEHEEYLEWKTEQTRLQQEVAGLRRHLKFCG
jgi:uncharacterized membrane protein YgaE (UPF0421/DUF939 family)